MNENLTYNFQLFGRIVPKARPRHSKSNGKCYLPQNYRLWKNSAIAELIRQKLENQLDFGEGIERSQISLSLYGKHRGDLDNLAGSVLDALVQANILQDDNLTVVNSLSIEHQISSKTGCSIQVATIN